MLTRRQAFLAYLAGLCALPAGCQSPTTISAWFARKPPPAVAVKNVPPAGQAYVLLDPGMEIQWQVRTAQDQPGQVKSGKGLIGPDGTVVIGPYGTCMVAGLTLDQATRAFERQLSPYMKAPSVQLSTAMSLVPADTAELAWRPSRIHGQPVVVTAPAPEVAGTSREGGIQPAAWRQ